MHSGLIYHEVSGAQWSSIGARNLKVYGHGYTEYFLCPTVVTRRKNTFHKIISLTPSWIFLLSGLLNWARLTRKEWRKMFFAFSHELGTKKKFWVPMRNRASGLRIPRSDIYHWATETSRWARSITKFIWHASFILLRSAMSIASCL